LDFGTLGYDAFMRYFEKNGLDAMRSRVLQGVAGRVLELGPGTGINLGYYDSRKITSLTYLDLKIRPGLVKKARALCPDITLRTGDAGGLPFEDGSFDHVVFTLVFCSVADPIKGLQEVRRVLRPGGTLHFIEHVQPPGGLLRPVFNQLNPLWRRIAGGCNLNRSTLELMTEVFSEVRVVDRRFSDIFVGGTARP